MTKFNIAFSCMAYRVLWANLNLEVLIKQLNLHVKKIALPFKIK